MDKPSPTEEAEAFFSAEHEGQEDLQGRDYFIHHLIPVAHLLLPLGTEAYIAGLGHDYIEDVHPGGIARGVAALLDARIPEASIEAIVAVTRLPGETYAALIDRACAHPLGTEVKLADNEVNLRGIPSLAQVDYAKARSLTGRYLNARDRLIRARIAHGVYYKNP